MPMKTDVAIVGGGPGGAATSLFLRKAGIDSVIVEKDAFPRYHIGESMTGECGNLVRELGLEAPMMHHDHPIKRGVTVYGGSGHAWFVPVMARPDEGELEEAFTWQVRRSEFDTLLLDAAVARGATLVSGAAKAPLIDARDAVRGVHVETADGKARTVEADVLVDASGRSTFLYHSGLTGDRHSGKYDRQIAVFSQVVGAERDTGPHQDDTLIFYRDQHHWAWFIPLDEEAVSVGVVAPASHFLASGESKRDFLVRELGELNPELRRRIPEVNLVEEVRAITNYSYEVEDFAGRGFMCVGDAHRFIDPIFSFGLFFAIQEAKLAAQAIEEYLGSDQMSDSDPFDQYARLCDQGQEVIQDLVDCFWEYPLAFALFVHQRYREDIIDLFSGRIYGERISPGLEALRKLLNGEPG